MDWCELEQVLEDLMLSTCCLGPRGPFPEHHEMHVRNLFRLLQVQLVRVHMVASVNATFVQLAFPGEFATDEECAAAFSAPPSTFRSWRRQVRRLYAACALLRLQRGDARLAPPM